jgi:hypothetical protein
MHEIRGKPLAVRHESRSLVVQILVALVLSLILIFGRDGEVYPMPPHCFEHLLEVPADPQDHEHDRMREWAGGQLRDFDQAATDLLLRQTVGQVPDSVRLVLTLAAGGVELPGCAALETTPDDRRRRRAAWMRAGS